MKDCKPLLVQSLRGIKSNSAQCARLWGHFHRQWALRKPSMELVAQAVVLRWQMGWMNTPETEKVIAVGVSNCRR